MAAGVVVASMVRPLSVLVIVCMGAPLGLLTLAGLDAVGLGGPLASPGATLHVQVIDQERLGVVAGLARTESTSLFGLGATTTTPASGWVVVVPETVEPPSADTVLTVTDELAFTDPNGATWLAREVAYGGAHAWIVPVGPVVHDPTLDADYNFALVVDWDKVPAGAGMSVTVLEGVRLA